MTLACAPWIDTAGGGSFDLLRPSREQVDWRDIGHALAHICRFTGHTAEFYSVAEHSVRVALLVADAAPNSPRALLYALLHDAHEAYIGDWSTPLKSALKEIAADEGFSRRLTGPIDAAIFTAFGLPAVMPEDLGSLIKHADLVMLATEKRDLLRSGRTWNIELPAPLAGRIVPYTAAEARGAWFRFMASAMTACGLLPPVRPTAAVA
jgi:hypothetical protein